ncbi:unnamed protein product, partial [marine sediment metagenome]
NQSETASEAEHYSPCRPYLVKAFAEFGLDLEKEAQSQFATDEILPWEHLGGPEKDYLLGHLNEALLQITFQ